MGNFSFAERLKALRGAQSKSEFARIIGVSPPVYQRYEEGRVPRANILSVIAERCGVSIEYLLGDNPGLAEHASGGQQPHHSGHAPPVAAHDLHVREHPPSYGNIPATPLQTSCRLPASCDLPHELADMKAQLAMLSTQVDTLTRLLGATLAANIAHNDATGKRKVG
jgi:transcriptional regulator with XRE-family HTH domain